MRFIGRVVCGWQSGKKVAKEEEIRKWDLAMLFLFVLWSGTVRDTRQDGITSSLLRKVFQLLRVKICIIVYLPKEMNSSGLL